MKKDIDQCLDECFSGGSATGNIDDRQSAAASEITPEIFSQSGGGNRTAGRSGNPPPGRAAADRNHCLSSRRKPVDPCGGGHWSSIGEFSQPRETAIPGQRFIWDSAFEHQNEW